MPRTLTIARVLSAGIALVAAVVSYRTQLNLLRDCGVDTIAAAAIPLTVDLLAVLCALIVHTPGTDRSGRRLAAWILALAGTVSVAANALAGDSIGSRVAHVWCVLAYLAAECVAARVHAAAPAPRTVSGEEHARRSAAAVRGAATRRRNKEAAAKAARALARAARREQFAIGGTPALSPAAA